MFVNTALIILATDLWVNYNFRIQEGFEWMKYPV